MLTERQIFHFCVTLINATVFPQGGECQGFGLVVGDKCNLVDNYQGFRLLSPFARGNAENGGSRFC